MASSAALGGAEVVLLRHLARLRPLEIIDSGRCSAAQQPEREHPTNTYPQFLLHSSDPDLSSCSSGSVNR
jgi:hypothetical protein